MVDLRDALPEYRDAFDAIDKATTTSTKLSPEMDNLIRTKLIPELEKLRHLSGAGSSLEAARAQHDGKAPYRQEAKNWLDKAKRLGFRITETVTV